MSGSWPQPLAAVWFDLDGTLVDSAPDLHHAVTTVCTEEGVPAPAYADFRPRVSRGGMAMLDACFPDHGQGALERLLPRFLDVYADRLDRDTRLFEGMDAILDDLDRRQIPWGIVTNKVAALGEPLLRRLGLRQRAVACAFGDSLAVKKPDPAQLLLVCREAGVDAAQCIYVGDDERDMLAAHAAGMPGVVAGWGYLDGSNPQVWAADRVLEDVAQLATLLAAP